MPLPLPLLEKKRTDLSSFSGRNLIHLFGLLILGIMLTTFRDSTSVEACSENRLTFAGIMVFVSLNLPSEDESATVKLTDSCCSFAENEN